MKRSEIVETTGSNTGVDRNPSATDAEPRTEHRAPLPSRQLRLYDEPAAPESDSMHRLMR